MTPYYTWRSRLPMVLFCCVFAYLNAFGSHPDPRYALLWGFLTGSYLEQLGFALAYEFKQKSVKPLLAKDPK